MKILILSQYFWPESFLINDLTKVLASQGHEVCVATAKPNYPDGIIFRGYKASGCQNELFDEKIEVVRVPIWPRGKGGALNLSLNYLSFVISGLIFFPFLLMTKKIDAIIVFANSPITQAIPAILLKYLKGAVLAVWVQDLWPESLKATGFIKNRYLLWLVSLMVRLIYFFSDLLLVQSKSFSKHVSRLAKTSKIHYYPNSMLVENSSIDLSSLDQSLISRLEKSFSIVFAGNLGFAQSLNLYVEAAKKLRIQYPEICIFLVGSGSRSDWLVEQKDRYNLSNLVLPGRYESRFMPLIFSKSDVLAVSLTEDEIFSQTIPSKVQAYLATGKPIIASLNGEGAQVIIESGSGLVSKAEDLDAFVENIIKLYKMCPEEREKLGMLGKRFFNDNFEMSKKAQELVTILEVERGK